MMNSFYRTVTNENSAILKEKGSKFLAFLFSVQSELQFKKRLNELKAEYPDAVHHCFAYCLESENNLERFSDDGEPSGTAGKPILGQLKSAEITNCAIIVVRYFGGIKLGTGGLLKAYRTVSKQVIESAILITEELKEEAKITCTFDQSGSILSLLKKYRAEIISKKGSDYLDLHIGIPKSEINNLETQISQFNNVTFTRQQQ